MIAQQKPRSLWAIQALVAGHGDERRVQFVHPHRQDPGGLGRVQHKGHARFGAQGGHLSHRLHAAEHIGHMVADHHVHALCKRCFQLFYHSFRLKRQRVQDGQCYVRDGVERPGHGVVLVAGDHHAAARLHQCVNGDIQSVGGVAGKDHIGFVLHAEQLRRSRPAGIVRFLRQLGSLMAAPPRRGHGIDRTRHGAADRTRLFQRSGSGIEIDHTATSLYPAPLCRRTRSGIMCACCKRCCTTS